MVLGYGVVRTLDSWEWSRYQCKEPSEHEWVPCTDTSTILLAHLAFLAETCVMTKCKRTLRVRIISLSISFGFKMYCISSTLLDRAVMAVVNIESTPIFRRSDQVYGCNGWRTNRALAWYAWHTKTYLGISNWHILALRHQRTRSRLR